MGYRLNCLDELVFMAVSKPMQTEFGIHHRLESCDAGISRSHFSFLFQDIVQILSTYFVIFFSKCESFEILNDIPCVGAEAAAGTTIFPSRGWPGAPDGGFVIGVACVS